MYVYIYIYIYTHIDMYSHLSILVGEQVSKRFVVTFAVVTVCWPHAVYRSQAVR